MKTSINIPRKFHSAILRFKRWQARGRRKLHSNKGYTHVYDDLVFHLTRSLSDVTFFWLLLWLVIPIALTIPIVLSETVQQQLGFLLFGTIFFIIAWGLFVLLVGFLAMGHASRPVLLIAAYILTAVPKPHRRETTFGLNYQDIDKLEHVAQVEQGAADWRNGVVTVLIIGSVTAILGTSWAFWGDLLFVINYGYQVELFLELDRPGLPTWFIVAIGITIFIAAVNFFHYIVRFVTRESANRTVLFACIEARSLLEQLQLTNECDFTNLQKRALAAHLGCRLIPAKKSNFYEKFVGWPVDGLGEKTWFLIPPVKYSYDAQILSWYNKFKHWITR